MKTAKKSENPVDLESAMSQAPGNGTSGEKSPSNARSSSIARGATGPRTKEGKERSKYNALKHGISSKTLLRGESRMEFNSMLNGLRDYYRPVGAPEEILVEKLASLLWRYCRFLIAEGAEIERGKRFAWWYKSERDEQETAIFLRSEEKIRAGLVWRLDNPFIRNRCIEILQRFKEVIQIRGFDSSVDRHLLALVYGDAEMTAPRDSLVLSYGIYSHRGEYPDIKELQNLATPERRKAAFLEDLQYVIERLEDYAEVAARFSGPRKKLESLCRSVPDAPELDRLLRYEASLERNIDRTMSQLERLQRMRRGQPVPPPINLNVSSS
jgi:hypothetical protein